jgi:ABC-type multidrug transport system fused ATPase/permease subunit
MLASALADGGGGGGGWAGRWARPTGPAAVVVRAAAFGWAQPPAALAYAAGKKGARRVNPALVMLALPLAPLLLALLLARATWRCARPRPGGVSPSSPRGPLGPATLGEGGAQRGIDGASVGGGSEPPAVLEGVDLRIARGSLCAVVGRVGVGKTALLQGLLGKISPGRESHLHTTLCISVVTRYT